VSRSSGFSSGFDSLLRQDTLQEYLRRLDARAVLEHYGARNCTEQAGGDGTTEIVHSCLLDQVGPHHSNGDEHPSAACNIDKRAYVCYALGWGGSLFRLIQKLENKESLSETLGTVGQFLTGATQDSSTMLAELDKLFNPTLHSQIDLPAYSTKVLDGWSRPHPYWTARGITAEAIAALRLGYDEREGRIVFPHFVNGTLVGWQKRAIPGESKDEHPKYRNSSGFPKSETLYNLDIARLSPRVCVVESPMSVAHAMSLGIPNVVGSWGAKVSEMQLAFLRSFERVYVWFDRDAAGIAGEKKLVEGLYRHTDVYVVNPDRGRDMADCNLGEIETKLSEAVPAALRLGSYGIRP